jgi:DNA-binding NarL/FixJ family response regulator
MKTKKILIIEDEKIIHNKIKKRLKENKTADYEILSAYDGVKAINLLEKPKIDMVLMDLIVPLKDGFEILREIQKRERFNYIPIVVYTNVDDIEKIYESTRLGVDYYLIKADYSDLELVEKLEQIIQKK